MAQNEIRPIPASSYVERSDEKDRDGKRKNETNVEEIKDTLREVSEQMTLADGIIALFPDLYMVRDVKTSFILAPKTMMFGGLRFAYKSKDHSGNDKAMDLLDTLANHFKNKTSFEKDIPKMINDALFTYGADVCMMIPPSYIDKIIHSDRLGLESSDSLINEFTSLKKLSGTDMAEFDRLGVDLVTDNPGVLQMRAADARYGSNEVEVGLESAGFRSERLQAIRMLDIPEEERTTDEVPLLFKLPMDTVLPISDPADPSHHLMYVIILDERGYPASKVEDLNYFTELQKRLDKARGDSTVDEYYAAKKLGFDCKSNKGVSVKEMFELYIKQMEALICKAVKASSSRQHFEMSEWEAFYKIMFARFMAKKQTKILLAPPYLVDYMAFDYNRMGIGRSLLDKTKLYSSLRAVVMFSDLIRQLANSIPKKTLNVTIDEDDSDPNKTIHNLVATYGRYMDRELPLTSFSPTVLVDELRRSGIRLNIDGGSRYPNTKLEPEETQTQIARVDTELAELLKKNQYAGFSVSPQFIDQAMQGDFAIDTITQNQLMCKRSMVEQMQFRELFMRRVRKYILLSDKLFKEVSKVAKGDDKVLDLLDDIDLNLPQATDTTFQQQYRAYQNYSQMIRDLASSYISDAMFRGIIQADISQQGIDQLKEFIIAPILRQWALKENIAPELEVLFKDEPDDKDGYAQRAVENNKRLFANLDAMLKGIVIADVRLQNVTNKARTDEQKKYQNDDSDSNNPNDQAGGSSSGGFGGFGGSSSGGFGSTTSMPVYGSSNSGGSTDNGSSDTDTGSGFDFTPGGSI